MDSESGEEASTLRAVDRPLGIVLLLALPASGKSEIRRYLASLPPHVARSDFNLGPTIQIDDYPYVHLMRRISQEQVRLGSAPAFFADDTQPFLDDRDWGTLTVLLDEDYQALKRETRECIDDPARRLLDRLDRARAAAGAPAPFDDLDSRAALEAAIAKDAAEVVAALPSGPLEEGETVVMEFARGGPRGSVMPLPPPFGYRYALSMLSPEILSRAAILYVWVSPEESRRKNRERARPGADGSILHHGVPEAVMEAEYGVDDMAWLLESSDIPGTVTVNAHGRVFHLPAARFDNRVDRTSFLRADPGRWPPNEIRAVHEELQRAFRSLQESREALDESGDVGGDR
ncbi:hypothetical protein BMS3Abin02_00936 [bacterium BMS3Abin02]|nr:hypothetical protein BMS3Abin02_00936 [bacterium BMS3Abin02]